MSETLVDSAVVTRADEAANAHRRPIEAVCMSARWGGSVPQSAADEAAHDTAADRGAHMSETLVDSAVVTRADEAAHERGGR